MEHGDRLIFEANPNYFRGAPKMKRIVVKIVPDTNTLIIQLGTHEIDFTSDVDPGQVAAVHQMTDIAMQITSSDGFPAPRLQHATRTA